MAVLKGFAVVSSLPWIPFFPTIEEALTCSQRATARKHPRCMCGMCTVCSGPWGVVGLRPPCLMRLGLCISEEGAPPKSVSFRRKPEHHEGAMQLLKLEAREFKILEVHISDVHALHEEGWSLRSKYTCARAGRDMLAGIPFSLL